MTAREQFDCIIIGGGPAGSAAGCILADFGRRVLILERGRFPRHHIGESLMPQTYWTFKRIGMLEQLEASDFPRKESVQFVSASGKESLPYYFTDRDPNPWSVTWQVTRDRFDRMMLDNAQSHGAEVREGVKVRQVLFEGNRAVGVRAEIDGSECDLAASVVIDATGQSALLARQLGLRIAYPQLRNAAIYAYYEGAHRDEGRNAGATIVISTPSENGWFWSIPLAGDVTSIGVVAPPSYLCSGRGDDPAATLEEEIALSPGICSRLASARRIGGAYTTSDFSYGSSRIAGDGWVLIGDAFGFLDPIYSSGVMLALKSGEMAADAVHGGLEAGDLSGERLGAFGPQLAAGMHLIRQLVHAFYDRDFSFAKFLAAHPNYRDHLVRLLIGDVFNDEVGAIFDVMGDWTRFPEPMRLSEESPAK